MFNSLPFVTPFDFERKTVVLEDNEYDNDNIVVGQL